jgi:mannosyltransferase OCH1-like enzyme
MTIPTHLHQMFLDTTEYDNDAPPRQYQHCLPHMQTWKDHHPTWQYTFWNRRRVDQLWTHPQLVRWKSLYDRLHHHMERCDLSRYALLYIYGGVYVDLDFICLRPLDSLLRQREFGWAYEVGIHTDDAPSIQQHMITIDGTPRRIANGFLMSARQHWIWPRLLDYIDQHYNSSQGVLLNTGTTRLSIFAHHYSISPEYYLSPCLIMPLEDTDRPSAECASVSLGEAYCYTKWKDGTNWTHLSSQSVNLWFLIIPVIIIIISVLIYSRSWKDSGTS